MSYKSEIEKLAKFFTKEYPELIEEGTPVDNAIRLLRKEYAHKGGQTGNG